MCKWCFLFSSENLNLPYPDLLNKCEEVFETSGLVVHESYPFMGASPDGIINCKCCGFGVLEITCRETSFREKATESTFFLVWRSVRSSLGLGCFQSF